RVVHARDVTGLLKQALERDAAIEPGITREKHFAHTAMADAIHDHVRPDVTGVHQGVTAILTMAFFNSPRPPSGACASSGKKIAKRPGGTLSHVDGRSSKNAMSFASSKPPDGGRQAASGDHPISSMPSNVYWMSMYFRCASSRAPLRPRPSL